MNNENWQSTMETISSIANELRLEGKFCDAILKVENVEFQVHKVIMCAFDPFFITHFLNSSDTECTHFTIEGMSHGIMSQIIDFAYTGSVKLDNIFELMITAKQLHLKSLVRVGTKALKDQLCPENCIAVWQFANTNHILKLQCEAFDFICDHFEEVVLCEGFLQLAVQELADILGQDDLNVGQEVTVYETVLRWINYKPDERQGTIATLLSKVRLGMMDKDYIREIVSNNDLVKRNSESNLMVLQVTRSQFKINKSLFRPRLPNAILLVVGGQSYNGSYNDVESYDYWTDRWFRVPMCNPLLTQSYHGTVFLSGSVYVLGGQLNTVMEVTNSVHRFNTYTYTWQEMLPMDQPRSRLTVTVLNECIYAIGGFNGKNYLCTAECYQPNINQWMYIGSMSYERIKASCATLNNKIYVCGGFNGAFLANAECYNPDTNQWTLISPMRTRRWGLGVTAYADHIFAVGGFNGTSTLKSAEAYNPLTNTWHNVTDMINSRSYFGIAVINKRLFVVGDYTDECYDSTTNSWSHVRSMNIPRIGLSCCVISGLSNMAEYCAPRDPILLSQNSL